MWPPREREAAALSVLFQSAPCFLCGALIENLKTFLRGDGGVSADLFPRDQSSKQIQHENCFAAVVAPRE